MRSHIFENLPRSRDAAIGSIMQRRTGRGWDGWRPILEAHRLQIVVGVPKGLAPVQESVGELDHEMIG